MKYPSLILTLLFCIPILLLISCKPQIDIDSFLKTNSKKSTPDLTQQEIGLEDVLRGNKLIALADNKDLYLIDPEFSLNYKLYSFAENEKPVNLSLDNFKISPNKNWIVWYTPNKGIISLNTKTLKTKIINNATDFLNTYPYFEFLDNSNIVQYITDKGNTFVKFNLETFDKEEIKIPFPYGNTFKVAPDQNMIVFISGYGQTQKPTFMVTNYNGDFINQFSADINILDRHQIFWAPDSSGLFLIYSNILKYYPLTSLIQPQDFFTFKDSQQIDSASIIDSNIFIYTNDGYWHIINYQEKKEIARTPLEIAQEIKKPYFIPYNDNYFLIEETNYIEPTKFNRLWISNLQGSKKIIMNKYSETVVETYPKVLE